MSRGEESTDCQACADGVGVHMPVRADELGNLLQRKFKTSCSVARLPGKVETGKEIALQGNLLQARLFSALYVGLSSQPVLSTHDRDVNGVKAPLGAHVAIFCSVHFDGSA